jgi:hypothetical protein
MRTFLVVRCWTPTSTTILALIPCDIFSIFYKMKESWPLPALLGSSLIVVLGAEYYNKYEYEILDLL